MNPSRPSDPAAAPEAANARLPADLHYTPTHEWVRVADDGTLLVGITAHAQDALGELVYIELPAPGRRVAAGDACVVVESTKAASDVYAPVSGEIVAVNDALVDAPQTVNASPYGEGWLFRLLPADGDAQSALGGLLSAEAYAAQQAAQA